MHGDGQGPRSCLRELMSSLVNTFRRCYWTVRGLMKSRALISGLDRPSRTSLAICASCAVRSSAWWRRCVCGPFPRWPAARGGPGRRSRRRPWPKTSRSAARSCAGVGAPVLAAQPLAVDQVHGPVGARIGCDRGARAIPGRSVSATSPSLTARRRGIRCPAPTESGSHLARRHPVARSPPPEFAVAGARRGLGQLRDDQGAHAEIVVVEDRLMAASASSWRPNPLSSTARRRSATVTSTGHRPPRMPSWGLETIPGLACWPRHAARSSLAEPERQVPVASAIAAILADQEPAFANSPRKMRSRPGIERELEMDGAP